MTDVENTTGDPDLDGTSELFRAGLEQSRRVSVMARSRVVNLIRAGGGSVTRVIGEREARAAAQRARAQLVVVPAVRRTSEGFEVEVRAASLTGNATLVARERAGSKLTLAPAVDRASRRFREAIHDKASEAPPREVALAEVAPADPAALRHLAEGRRLHSEARFDEALTEFEKAVEADPAFPQPRLEIIYHAIWHLSAAYRRYLDPPVMEAYRGVVRANLHRLAGKDRAYADYLLAVPVEDEGNGTEALQAIDRQLEAWPDETRLYEDSVYITLSTRADLEAARPYLEGALERAPLAPEKTIDWLVALGRLDEALARARRWVTESPTQRAFASLAFVHRHRGEIAEALEAARRAASLAGGGPSNPGVFLDADALEEFEAQQPAGEQLAGWLAVRGRVREALAAYDAGLPPDAPQPLRSDHHFFRAFLLLPRGDADAIWREMDAFFHVGGGFFACHALQLGLLGDLERSWPLTWRAAYDHHVCYRLYHAVRLWHRGRREEALRDLGRIDAPSSDLYRAEILSELGRDRAAVEGCRSYRRRRGLNLWDGNFDGWNYPRSLYVEAAALERLGERDEARRVLGRLLHLWERADPELPLLARARSLRARLDSAPRVEVAP